MERPKPPRILEFALAVLVSGLLGAALRGCGDRPLDRPPPVAATGHGSLDGRIFDRATGAGLMGATVELEGPDGLLTASTGPDGRYHLAEITAGSHRLRAYTAGYLQKILGLYVGANSLQARDVGLERVLVQGSVDGRVEDAETAAPLPGVRVEDAATGQGTVSDASGRFFLAGLPVGAARLRLILQGYVPKQASVEVLPGGVSEPYLVLVRAAGTLVGTVQGAPPVAPLPHALVSLPGLGIETVTGSDGSYRLEDVPAFVPVDVMFSEPSHDSLLVTTSLGAFQIATLNVTLSRGFGEVQGVVRQFGGTGLAGALVSMPLVDLTTTTDGAGNYSFPRVPAGFALSIGASAANHVSDGVAIIVPPGGLVTQDFELIPLTGSVTGTVQSTGTLAAIPGVLVTLPHLFRSTSTNASGDYTFVDLPTGQHQADFSAAGYSELTTFLRIEPGVSLTQDQLLPSL